MSVVGPVLIRVDTRDGETRATVTAPTPLPIGRMLIGRPPEEAAELLPRIWSSSAAAEELSARSALGLSRPAELTRRAGEEALREHVLRLSIALPEALGQAADGASAALVGAASGVVHGIERASDVSRTAARRLGAALFAPSDRAPESWADFTAWAAAGRTAPARALARLLSDHEPHWGRADLPVLDPREEPEWPEPRQNGGAAENGPVIRLSDSKLLREVEARLGRGPIWRALARLEEVCRLLRGIWRPAETPRAGIAHAPGGLMMTRAEIRDGRITAFARLSPTDFALAPGGVLERALAALPHGPDAPVAQAAAAVVATVDPSVHVELEVDGQPVNA